MIESIVVVEYLQYVMVVCMMSYFSDDSDHVCCDCVMMLSNLGVIGTSWNVPFCSIGNEWHYVPISEQSDVVPNDPIYGAGADLSEN